MLKKFFKVIIIFLILNSLAYAEQLKSTEGTSASTSKFVLIFIEDFNREKLYQIYLPNLVNLYEMGYSGVIEGQDLAFQQTIERVLKLKGFATNFPILAEKYGYKVYGYGFNLKNYSGFKYLPNLSYFEAKLGSKEKYGFILAFKKGQEKLADKIIEKLYETGSLQNTVVAIIGSGNEGVFGVFAQKLKKNVRAEILVDDGIISIISLALGIYPQEEWGPVLWSAIYTGDWEKDNQNRIKEQKEILTYVLKLRQSLKGKDLEIAKYSLEKEKLLTKLAVKNAENRRLTGVIKRLNRLISALKLLTLLIFVTGVLALFLEYKFLKKKYLLF
ncbi:hypothetical protein [Carboxydothermus hydrogenoformans]|uniref:Uncharacterized protein n=1 Tax=Carboxydothermus hydrogenoformans (strain ATCC BAA-161 / DSM 6008 / Z-2901) TaxID=246194 RepID=Q3ACS6_CARHZ|nr:hypothetical protein [Carboxydothermus hydrogenoformans]ABB14415.1 hypothetical protein CHY_1219 [Carboxydothermus hydrogenoformans Z-2901]